MPPSAPDSKIPSQPCTDLTASMTEDDNAMLLSALSEVRESLRESFLAGQPSTFCPRGIQADFEIKVISDDDDANVKHHGCCEFSIVGGAGWTSKGPAVQRANEFKVRSVSVQLTSTDGAPLPLELVTSTFLHELAHSVTPPERWRSLRSLHTSGAQGGRRRRKELDHPSPLANVLRQLC